MIARLGCVSILIPALTAVVLLVVNSPFAIDNDIYAHLAAGRWMFENGTLMTKDVMSYTAAGAPNETHSWLAQIFFWILYDGFGERGIRSLVLATTFATVLLAARFAWLKTRDLAVVSIVATVVVLVHQHNHLIRPMIFGEVMIAWFAFVLLRGPMTVWRFVLSALSLVLWMNLHPSGAIMVPVFALYAAVEVYRVGKSARAAKIPFFHDKSLRLVIASPFMALGATLLTPAGLGLYAEAASIAASGRALRNIEWMSPFASNAIAHLGLPYLMLGLVLLAACVNLVGFLRRHQTRDIFDAALSFALALLPLLVVRNFLYFVVPAVLQTVYWWPRLFHRQPPHTYRVVYRAMAGLAVSLVLLVGIRPWKVSAQVDLIEKATAFLKESGVEGSLFNFPEWGSYLSFHLYPKVQIASEYKLLAHGRTSIETILEFERHPQGGLGNLVGRFPGTDFMIFGSWIPSEVWPSPDEWMLVFENSTATVLLRRNKENSENLHRIAAYYRKQDVPFDITSGLLLGMAATKVPEWIVAQQERAADVPWPSAAAVKQQQERLAVYAKSRRLPVR